MLCVSILYISGHSLKSTPNDRFFLKNFSWQFYFTHRVFVRNLRRGNCRRNTFRILLWCLAWDSNPGFSSNKPTYYLLHQGELVYISAKIKMISYEKMIFLSKSASSVSRSQAHLAKRCSSVYPTLFVRRKDKTNYLSNQTRAKCYHSRNKL